MLMAGSISTRRMTDEVRPPRCKMGWSRASGADPGGRGGDFAVAAAIAAPFRLPVVLGSDYSRGNQGRMGRHLGNVGLYNSFREGKSCAINIQSSCFSDMLCPLRTFQ